MSMALSTVLLGQEARLNGTVTDSTGAVLEGTRVRATQVLRNVTFETTTTQDGRYLFPRLPIGTYQILAEANGFKQYVRNEVVLTTNADLLLNIEMQLGSVNEQVTVSAEASRVSTETSTIQQLVDSKRIADLPLNGRNVYQLAKLVPGVGESGTQIGGGRAGSQNSTMVNVRVDGVLNVDNAFGEILPSPSPDAVQEFTIQTSVPPAKYGFASGVVEVSTRSGTNELHGTLYEFFRNDKLDARNFFLSEKTRRKRNQYGFAGGGPVFIPKFYDGRNRTFWFVNFEQQKEPLGAPVTIFVPTEANLRGDFSNTSTVIRDPSTNEPFPNNQIPEASLDPLALNFARGYLPAAQDNSGVYRYQRANDNNPTQLLLRGDQILGSSQHQLSGRMFITRRVGPGASGNVPIFTTGTTRQNTDLLGLTHAWTVSPTMINTARFGFNGFFTDPDYEPKIDLAGLHSLGFSPNYYTYTPNFPLFNVSGFFQASIEQIRITRDFGTYTFANDFSWITGRHNIQVGFDGLRTLQNTANMSRTNGSFTFNGNFTGLAMMDFILGLPSLFRQGSPAPDSLKGLHLNWYVQDDFKVNQRLTLNFGLRYELPFAPVPGNGAAIIAREGAQSQVFPNAPQGLLFPGDPGVPKGGRTTVKNLFAPRVGLSWAITGDQKTVLRAGYGVYYNPSWTNLEGQFAILQPFTRIIDLVAPPSTSNPWADYLGGNPHPYTPNANSPFDNEINTLVYGPNFREIMMQQWNLNIQREITPNTIFTVGYAGTRGTRIPFVRDSNAPVYIPGQSTVANTNQRRPMYPQFARFNVMESGANSSYNSLQASVDRRLSKGVSILVAYTFSKALADLNTVLTGGTGASQDPYDRHPEWGPADLDRTHALVTSWVWQVPSAFHNPFANAVLGNWEVNGILALYSGAPLSITASQDRSRRAHPNRPNRLSDPRLSTDRSRSEQIGEYFNRASYVVNEIGEFGSAPRAEGQLRGPGEANVSLGIMKRFRGFAETHNFQFRGEMFNAFNRPNFNDPGTNIDQPASFGRITSAGDGRIVQLALKYIF
jgi:hypothetical protein